MTKAQFFQILDVLLSACDEFTIADEVKIAQAIKKALEQKPKKKKRGSRSEKRF